MGSIRELPEAVRSSMRSGVILFDLTRVVEELVFNSLDAGATKVVVAVGVGTNYIKVTDNGCGITRDGLVLLGERYATSKIEQLADMDTLSESFGFRGEALGSISDVSLLEIVTKAHGMPNGYRKVIKGCKCLYLGIDDDRRDVGTTVVVRDLFYNQPVRRRHLRSSPQKILQSVKECILRIALVHLRTCFKMIDTESGDELLCVYPSSSPLPLLMSSFGTEVSNSLCKLDASDGDLKLSGYISGPFETFSMKAFQYFYINSRFISKGPIHKLLNQLSTTHIRTDLLKADIGSECGKRSRSLSYPTYILNLSCPRTQYDLNIEPTKTSVAFKDWDHVLAFIQKSVSHFWSQENFFSHADMSPDHVWNGADTSSTRDDLLTNYGLARKRCMTRCDQASRGHSSTQLDMLEKEQRRVHTKSNSRYSCDVSERNAAQFEEDEFGMDFACLEDYSLTFTDKSLRQREASIPDESSSHLGLPNSHISSEDLYLENKCTRVPFRKHKDHRSGIKLQRNSLGDDCSRSKRLLLKEPSSDPFHDDYVEKIDMDLTEPYLKSCSSSMDLVPALETRSGDKESRFQVDGLDKWPYMDDRIDNKETGYNIQDFEPWKGEARTICSSPWVTTTDSLFSSRGSLDSISTGRLCLTEDYNSWVDPVASVLDSESSHRSFKFDWSASTYVDKMHAEPLLDDVFDRRFNHHIDDEFDSEGRKDIFNLDSVGYNSSRKDCSPSSYMIASPSSYMIASPSPLKGHASCKKETRKSQSDGILFTQPYDFLDETEWLHVGSPEKRGTSKPVPVSRHMSSLSYAEKGNYESGRCRWRDKKPKRSCSAPPIYRGREKLFSLNNSKIAKSKKVHFDLNASDLQEAYHLKHIQKSSGVDHLALEEDLANNLKSQARNDSKKTIDKGEVPNYEMEAAPCLDTYNRDSDVSKENQGALDFGEKWRNGYPLIASREKPDDVSNQDSVLDISSGLLHLSGDSLLPKSISKKCLEDSRVLQQVDRKFIPVVAGGVLALIDQHAADERIRLEDLRRKVLSGEMKTITYLDAEQELVLPEIAYQLLHNYSEQIQKWGWICHIHVGSSTSFEKNLNFLHNQPSVATLIAVPSILGVNLTDVDLLEFLQQLSDTDGSSAIPPAVLRVLNLKACRGAIMFGDALLPSECRLIVEELKQTSLCFQCAHGRPTTVPLVNLAVLHKQIAKLRNWSHGSADPWHGLTRHAPSLERAARRLNSDGGQC